MTYRAKEHYKDISVATDYDRRRFRTPRGRLVGWRETKLMLDALLGAGIQPPASVVDVPCGTGRLSLALAAVGFAVTGLDVSEAMIGQARTKVAGARVEIEPMFVVGDAESMPFADGTFDAGVSLRLFGHLPPPARLRVLGELARVSKQGVVLSYYLGTALQGLLRRPSRTSRGVSWHPVGLQQIDAELATVGLRTVDRRFLLPFVSETVVVAGRKM